MLGNAKYSLARRPRKQPIYEMVRRLIRLPERIYRHLHFHGTIRVPLGPGISIRLNHHGYQVENDLFWAGYGNGWEATSLRLWARLSREARTVFDVGANTGVYSLAAKAMNPKAQVFAFEPVERIAFRLKDNVAQNEFDIEVVVAGVSETTGEAVIYEPRTAHAYSASLSPDMLAGHADLAEVRIAITRMDDFVAARGLASADLFKIDVEKHEIEALSGFGDLIACYRPAFLIEILDRSLGEKVEQYFAGLNYVFYEIIETQCVQRVEALGLSERNYLICSEEFAASSGLKDVTTHAELLL